jgi:hypothetical protein
VRRTELSTLAAKGLQAVESGVPIEEGALPKGLQCVGSEHKEILDKKSGRSWAHTCGPSYLGIRDRIIEV